jgi:TolA-binding protein
MLFLPSGNRAEGLKQVERAAASGGWFAPRAKLLLMNIYGSTEHRPGEALAIGRALQERYPANDHVGFALADLYLAAAVEDRAKAADVYQRIIERNKEDVTIDGTSARLRATLGLAGVRQEQWRLDEAVALLTPIVESGVARPSWALPQALLRRSNYRALLNDAAATADAKVILANPRMTRWHKSATSQIKWIEQRVASGEAGTYSALISANRLVADKQWAEARRAYEAFRARDPHNPQLRYRLAYLAFVSGEAERALPEMTAIAAGGKNVPDWMKAGALLVAARAHDLAGRREQARRTYQTIVDRYDDQGAAVSARLGLITPYARPS